MIVFFHFICFFPLSIAFTPPIFLSENEKPAHLKPPREGFFQMITASTECTELYNNRMEGLHSRNSTQIAEFMISELFREYITIHEFGIADRVIEKLLNKYCRAKNAVTSAHLKPPAYLKGNFTWDFTDYVPENKAYHEAKEEEARLLRLFEHQKIAVIREVLQRQEDEEAKSFWYQFLDDRMLVFLLSWSITFSLLLFFRLREIRNADDDE